jgi:hypothetical protein
MTIDNAVPLNITSNKALSMFQNAAYHGRLHGLWCRLTRRCFCLRQLDEDVRSGCVEARQYAGIQEVDIEHIKGTEGKADEFDAEFNPRQEQSRSRWMGIALQKLRGQELPPVALTKIGDVYYVRDGHHRISVSRAMGQSFIEAEVTSLRLCSPRPAQ